MKNRSWIESLLRRPYFIYSFLSLFAVLGMLGYNKIDRKLFPDSNYPEIAVVVVEPGGSAKTLAANVSVPIEEELYTLDKIRRVYSTTIDEVSVIHAEFEYSKNLDMAASDVTNSLSKIRSSLPRDIKEPQVHKISSATAPIVVIAVHGKNTKYDLESIRQLAQTDIKHQLLKIQGVSNVDIFGGYKKEIQIIIDKQKLDTLGLSFSAVLAKIEKSSHDYTIGFITNQQSRYLLKAHGKKESIQGLQNLQLTPDIKLRDVAKVYFGSYENSAEYYGNGKEAIAIAVQRSQDADVVRTIEAVEKELVKIRKKYSDLDFEITDTQKDTIVLSTQNMFSSLMDAIILSTIVVFIFLGSFRQVLVVMFTIPIVYLATIALMWIVGIEFNVVTLTAIILALGLLLDDTVVVMENIERHFREEDEDIHDAVFAGTREIMFADLSGTITTMIALAPMLFVGGYPQTVFQPLVATLLLALVASYVISITAVPLLSLRLLALNNKYLLKVEDFFNNMTRKANEVTHSFFTSALSLALKSKIAATLYIVLLLFLFGTSLRGVMPIVGQELMPPMDTGGVKIAIVTDSNLPIEKTQEILQKATKIIQSAGKLDYLSSSIGSEAGVLSIGSGSGIDHIAITATYVNRYERKESIWDIERKLRTELSKIPHIKTLDVVDYGATALASLRANIDVTLYGKNFDDLLEAGKLVSDAMSKTQGVVSVSQTWHNDKVVYNLDIDDKKLNMYNITMDQLVAQVQLFLRGKIVTTFPLKNATDFNVRVWVDEHARDDKQKILSLLIDTPKGKVPLSAIANIKQSKEPSMITREGLEYTLNVYGFREKAAISHIMNSFDKAFGDTKLPQGVEMEQTGDIKQFLSSAKRMIGAIGFAVILIFFTIITLFNSIKISLMIIFSIPLTVIGASWMMLLFGYHTSMPAMMGFILLSGIIVNNAILLIHFAQEEIANGATKAEAMLESIKIRTRPILMTAFAVAAGMWPVAAGSAIGLERLAPLGAVAIGGLIVGTFLTLLFIPLVFIWFVNEKEIQEEFTQE